jgi:prepilin-type N-terminal cleavage/methylation domain-containing protein
MRVMREPRRAAGCGKNPFRQRGFTLMELMAAIAVLAIGLLGTMALMLTGMQTNSASRTDTTATVLDQEIIEFYSTLKNYPLPGTVNIYDCALNGTNFHQANLGKAVNPGNGATLYTAASAPTTAQVSDVDWTQPVTTLATTVVPGYAMEYQTCSGDIYEVRWNVMDLTPAAPPAGSSGHLTMLTVSARQKSAVVATAAGASNRAVLFAVPVTLRSMLTY